MKRKTKLKRSPKDEKKAENIYFERLKKQKTDQEDFLADQVKRKMMDEGALDVMRESIKRIQYQIDDAKTKIANGETFGRTELQKVQDLLRKQRQAAIKRYQKDIDEKYKKETEKSQLEYEKKIAEAHRKYGEATGAAVRKYNATVGATALLAKFRASKNKLGIVIWNMPVDEKLHERFTRTVNIRLYKGEKVVWNRKNYKLSRKQASNPIKIPNVIFNKVVVDVVKWQGDGGGLAEIEVYAGTENIAANRPCEVTNSETLPIHLDDQHALTDGTTEPIYRRRRILDSRGKEKSFRED